MARRKSLFFPPRHRKIADIISIESPKKARHAIKTLLRMAKKAPRQKKVLIKRSIVLAANRAEASAKRKNLSQKEKRELRTVARLYRAAAKKIKLDGGGQK